MRKITPLTEFTQALLRLHYGPGAHASGTPQSTHGGVPKPPPPLRADGQIGFDFDAPPEAESVRDPDVPKEAWELTPEEYGVPLAPTGDVTPQHYRQTERIAREHPERVTPEMRRLLDETKAQERQHAKYLRQHAKYLPKANEHYRIVRDAWAAGKPLPPAVRAAYGVDAWVHWERP